MWAVNYKASKKSPWVNTGIGAPSSEVAWRLWEMWRTVHAISDYYTVEAVNMEAEQNAE